SNKLSGEIPTKELENLTTLIQFELYGKVPSIDYNNYSESEIICNFSGTKLCVPNDKESNSLCYYPETFYDCMGCIDYSYVEKGICQCIQGYVGIGYINCKKDTGNNNEAVSDLDLLKENDDDQASNETSFSPKKINPVFNFMNLFFVAFTIIMLKI
ncbi:hypothetical protein PIROE2DRAFT_12732, partial [Piromyces sp. E2]